MRTRRGARAASVVSVQVFPRGQEHRLRLRRERFALAFDRQTEQEREREREREVGVQAAIRTGSRNLRVSRLYRVEYRATKGWNDSFRKGGNRFTGS